MIQLAQQVVTELMRYCGYSIVGVMFSMSAAYGLSILAEPVEDGSVCSRTRWVVMSVLAVFPLLSGVIPLATGNDPVVRVLAFTATVYASLLATARIAGDSARLLTGSTRDGRDINAVARVISDATANGADRPIGHHLAGDRWSMSAVIMPLSVTHPSSIDLSSENFNVKFVPEHDDEHTGHVLRIHEGKSSMVLMFVDAPGAKITKPLGADASLVKVHTISSSLPPMVHAVFDGDTVASLDIGLPDGQRDKMTKDGKFCICDVGLTGSNGKKALMKEGEPTSSQQDVLLVTREQSLSTDVNM